MEDRERVLITEAVLTVGTLIVIKKMRDRKKRKIETLRKGLEKIVLISDLATWMETEGKHLSEDDFVTQYNDRVEFINIVTSS